MSEFLAGAFFGIGIASLAWSILYREDNKVLDRLCKRMDALTSSGKRKDEP